jgi:hypothetical protein
MDGQDSANMQPGSTYRFRSLLLAALVLKFGIAFAASAAARQFRQTVGPLLGSPYDERLFRRID